MFEIGNIVLVNENVREPKRKYFGKIGTTALVRQQVRGKGQTRYFVMIDGAEENKAIPFLEDELELIA